MDYLTRRRHVPPLLTRTARPPAELEGLAHVPRPAGIVVTVVRDSLRDTLDVGVDRPGALHHVPTVDHAAMLVCEPGVSALIVSPAALTSEDCRILSSIAARWSMVRVVALIDEVETTDPAKLIAFGASGPQEIIDLRHCTGWNRLRSLVDDGRDEPTQRLVAVLHEVLMEASPNTKQFFVHLARSASETRTIRRLAAEMGVLPSTLMSRFYRAQLPSPKCFLAATRLVLVRKLLDSPKVSLAAAAYRLRYSSPQSLSRTLRLLLGVTSSDFRQLHTYDQVLGHYVANLFVPFRGTFRTFDPFGQGTSFAIPARSAALGIQVHEGER